MIMHNGKNLINIPKYDWRKYVCRKRFRNPSNSVLSPNRVVCIVQCFIFLQLDS